MIRRLWRGLKTWRRVRLGPVALVFKLDRAVRVTRGTLKRSGSSHAGRVDVLGHGPNQSLASLQVAPDQPPRSPELAVIVGAGPGFGHSLAGLLAAEGFDLPLVARDADRLSALVSELHAHGVTVASYGADATDESAVAHAFDRITQVHGVPALVIYSLQYSGPG